MENLELARRRSELEKLGDILLFLYLVEDANKQGNVDGVTKLQKLVFLSENAMLKQNVVGFNYSFIKYYYGPFSRAVEHDYLKSLRAEILTESFGIKLTTYGKNLLNNFSEVIEKNTYVVEVIQEINSDFAETKTEDILEYVYNMQHPIRKFYTIENTKHEEVLIAIPSRRFKERSKVVFELTEDWGATLEVYLDPKFYRSLKRAQKDARRRTALSYEEVFGRA